MTEILHTRVEIVFLHDVILPTEYLKSASNITDIQKAKDALSLTHVGYNGDLVYGNDDKMRYEFISNRLIILTNPSIPIDTLPIVKWVSYLLEGFTISKIRAYGLNYIGAFLKSMDEPAAEQIKVRFFNPSNPVTSDELKGLSVRLFYGDLDNDYYDIRFSPQNLDKPVIEYQIHFHYNNIFTNFSDLINNFDEGLSFTKSKYIECIEGF